MTRPPPRTSSRASMRRRLRRRTRSREGAFETSRSPQRAAAAAVVERTPRSQLWALALLLSRNQLRRARDIWSCDS
eukprot:6213769-Pleurochrysis_carterae.AAC.2